MADTKLAKVGITVKESWKDDISYEVLDYTLWRVQDGGDGCGYIAKRANIGVVPNSDDSVWIKATQAGQSIYDLAVKYGHFVGTEEEFEAEYQAVLQAARDAASETSATNAEIQEAEELRRASEDERVDAEAARQGSEIAREAMESDRQIAENMRQMAETQRGENETTRQSQETARESSETQRQSNESTRQSNETARESAEQERTADFEALKTDMETAIGEADAATAAAVALNNQVAGDESARQQAEQSRVAAETQRQTAETQRGTNEQTRQTQETARQTAESTRNTQETARQTAEGQRATAEQGRASAESGRVSAETARQTAETAREEQATTDHQRAESDHAIAEEDHATLDEKISHKADIDGSYDGMAVGIARNLEGRTDVTDSFFERTTGGDAEVANGTAQLNEVKGKSQVWNQIFGSLNPITTSTISQVVDGRKVTTTLLVAPSTTAASFVVRPNSLFKKVPNHKYCIAYDLSVSVESDNITIRNGFSVWTADHIERIKASDGVKRVKFIVTCGSTAAALQDGSIYCYYNQDNSGQWDAGDTIEISDVQVFDLTLIFGAGNEPSTVEEFDAWLAENIGEQAYYPYNPGEVLNNRMTGVESIGFNLLDPTTGKADIIGAYSDVYGNYYGITGTHGTLTFTDKFGNTETITPDEDGKFLLETAGTLSVADAGEDCAVFLWWDGTQTEYKQYEKNVGALDVTHIYGKLNGEGDYVRVWPTGMPGIGDIKDSLKVVDGQVVAERKVGEVDMGTLDWGYSTNRLFFTGGQIGNIAHTDGWNSQIPMICARYRNTYPNNVYNENLTTNDKTISGHPSQNVVWLRDSAYSDGATFKAAMSGVLLYYSLATPEVYTDLIYRDSEDFADNTPVTLPVNYKVDNWGIERIAPQNTGEAVVTTKPELTMRYSIDAVEELNTHRDEIEDLYEKNEELDERKPEKYGEYPDMAVGSAKTLAGNDTKIEDFFFKPIDCADGLAKLNSARGKSWVWNQNAKEISTDNYSTPTGRASIDNGELTVYGAVGGRYWDNNLNIRNNPFVLVSGHKVFLSVVCTNYNINSSVSKIGMFCGQAANHRGVYVEISGVGRFSNIVTLNETIPLAVLGYVNTPSYAIIDENDSFTVKNIQIVDLTLMFGAGNEPATVDEFEAMFPLPYYDYNPGEIISNKTEEVKVTGFNQWDEEWEVGRFNLSTGENDNSTGSVNLSCIRTKNHIPVIGGRDYYIIQQGVSYFEFVWMLFFDSDKKVITGLTKEEVGSRATSADGFNFAPGSTIIMPRNAAFVRFYRVAYFGPTYNHDICLNLSDPSRNGEYEPYKTNTIELNLPTLTGKLNGDGESVVVFPDGLKSAGSVYDEIVGNKAIKRVGVVDLGTMTWVYTGVSSSYPYGYFSTALQNYRYKGNPCFLCENYAFRPNGWAYDKIIRPGDPGSDKAFIIDSSYTDIPTFKAAMSGVLLYYELETPEEYILDAPLPDTFQAYKGGTIKQLPENTSEPVTAPMVMTVTYAIDAVGTLVGLPRNYVSKESLQAMLNAMKSAGIIASYTMTYNENTGKYDFTFVAPTNS